MVVLVPKLGKLIPGWWLILLCFLALLGSWIRTGLFLILVLSLTLMSDTGHFSVRFAGKVFVLSFCPSMARRAE